MSGSYEFFMGLSETTRKIIMFIILGIISLAILIYYLKKLIPKVKPLIIKRRNKKLDKKEELYCVKCNKISKKKYFCSRCDYNLSLNKERSVK